MLKNFIHSPSTLLGFVVGIFMYIGYGISGKWGNIGLICVSVFVGFFLPFYSEWSNKAEEFINFKFAIVTLGRLTRFILQFLFNLCVFYVFLLTDVVSQENLNNVGGYLGISFLTTFASQGIQYVCIALSNRELGDKNRNVMIGVSVNILVTAFTAIGLTWARPVFLFNGIFFGCLVFGLGLLSDFRRFIAFKGGVGIFFGTFNPFHTTHIRILEDFIKERNLEKVYLHSTVIPKLHKDSLEKGEICIDRYERGMRIYERTSKADLHVNYFPTGNKFYEFETRKKIMEIAIDEASLKGKVEILALPEVYEKKGFYGIIKYVKLFNGGKRIHGLHGSDLGGMWIRSIYDECGWIYPYSVLRKDNVSATAIRNGTKGMTLPIIEDIIDCLNDGETSFNVRDRLFEFENGILYESDNTKILEGAV